MKIEAVSTDARDANWGARLSCPHFFDTQNYPAISLAGAVFNVVDEATVEIAGDLMTKGFAGSGTVPLASVTRPPTRSRPG
jgi:polyisoprenoid-binding protein YceI